MKWRGCWEWEVPEGEERIKLKEKYVETFLDVHFQTKISSQILYFTEALEFSFLWCCDVTYILFHLLEGDKLCRHRERKVGACRTVELHVIIFYHILGHIPSERRKSEQKSIVFIAVLSSDCAPVCWHLPAAPFLVSPSQTHDCLVCSLWFPIMSSWLIFRLFLSMKVHISQ